MADTFAASPDVNVWHDPRVREGPPTRAFTEFVRHAGAPRHLAKYDHGVYELAVDMLDDPELLAAGTGASAQKRDAYRTCGQQLAFLMTALDQKLAEAETGRLIRMVCHAERGALFCTTVTPQNYVLGIAFGAAALERRGAPILPQVELVRDADKCTCELADHLRGWLGLPLQNLGGWASHKPLTAAEISRDRPEPTGENLAAALAPNSLIYLARNRQGTIVEEADLFDHDEVAAARPAHLNAGSVRSFYRRLTNEFGMHSRQLGQTTRQAVRGRMLRIVLDVEQGAVYYYRLGPADYLVGVTVNQSQVARADEEVGALAVRLADEESGTDQGRS